MPDDARPETEAAHDPLTENPSSTAPESPFSTGEEKLPPTADASGEQPDAPATAAADDAAVATEQEIAAESWIELAAPYVERLAKHLSKEGLKNHSVSLPIGNHRVLVTPQEQRLVLQADGEVESNGVELDRYLQLVRDGIGLQVGILAQLRSYMKAEKSQRGPLYKALRESVQAANYLAYEMHRQTSVLSSAGDFDNARHCGAYRKNLLDATERALEVLGSGPDAFDLPAGAIATSRRRSHQAVSDAAERSEKELARERARKRLAEERARRRKKITIIVAVVSFVVLGAVLFWLWRQRPVALEHFNVNDFSRVPGIVTVANREPSIIIVVDAAEWNKLTENQKRGAVSLVADVVKIAGYREVEFRSQGRDGLAWWHKGTGITISKK